MAYNSKILTDLLQARSLTTASLSQRLGIGLADLQKELRREPEPRQEILRAIARDLALPPLVFYMGKAPSLHDVLPDFRSESPSPTAKSRETIEAIQLAEGIQRTASQNGISPAPRLPAFPNDASTIASFALNVRDFFGITLDDQREAASAKAFFNVCRRRIEDRGIFVLQERFPPSEGSGFCLSDPKFPVIVINTTQQSRGRRLFTLIHELAHVLMGRSGISDPFTRANLIERRCNHFAANFLVPSSYVRSLIKGNVPRVPTNDDVRRITNWLKISQEATTLRLEELGLFQNGTHSTWKAQFNNSGENPDFSDRGGGSGGPPPQEMVKLAKYGFRLAAVSDELLRSEKSSEIDVYRFTGIKPKYLRDYIEYARSLAAADLRSLDLDDA